MKQNSLDHLKDYAADEAPVSLTPPAIDLVARYRDAPALVESVFDNADELEALTPKALRKLAEIIDAETDFDSVNFVRVQVSAAATVLNTQVRVDEGRLRRRKTDILPKLLEMIAKEESHLKLVRATIDGELA